MSKIAAVYARVSTNTGKQDTDRQINKLVEIANSKGYKKVDVFADTISGYTKDRPELNKLMKTVNVDPKHYGLILADEISRIGRSPVDTRNIIDEISAKGVPIFLADLNQYTIDEKGQRNSIVNVILQMTMEFANIESQQMKERAHSGRLNKARKGEYMGGIMVPYGYSRVEKKLVIEENEAIHIRTMFQLASEGRGCNFIARHLNNSKIPTKRAIMADGKRVKVRNMIMKPENIKWHYNNVRYILRNSLYMGVRETMGVTVECPAIVSKELFDKVQLRLDNTVKTTSEVKYEYLLRSKLICAVCGKVMSGRYNPDSGADKSYKCLSHSRGHSCGNGGININYIESVVYDAIINLMIKINKFTINDDVLDGLKKKIEEASVNYQHFLRLKKDVETKNKKLLDVYLSETITEKEFKSRRKTFEADVVKYSEKVSEFKQQKLELEETLNKVQNSSDIKLVSSESDRNILRDVFNASFDKLYFKKLDKTQSIAYMRMYSGKFYAFLLTTDGYYGRTKKAYKYKYIIPKMLYSQPKIDWRDNVLVSSGILEKEFKIYPWFEIPPEHMLDMATSLK